MIISLRGTNGSGKSTVMRQVMAAADKVTPVYGMLSTRRPEAYRLQFGERLAYVLGPYTTASACGFDAITDFDAQPILIRKYAPKGVVLFEGLITGKLWGRVGAVLETLPPVALIFLNTSLEECIVRVVKRRHEAGDTRPFNEKNLRAVYDAARGNLRFMREKAVPGISIEELSSDEAPARCLELINT